MKHLICTDIDGTLINDQEQVTPKTRQALERRIKLGDLFIPVSARMPEAIDTVASDIGKHYPMISYNGALLLDEHDHEISSHPFKIERALKILSIVEENYPDVSWNVYRGHNWFSNKLPGTLEEEKIVQVESTKVNIQDIEKLPECHKILLIGTAQEIDELQTKLRAIYPVLDIVKSKPTLLEIMAKGINKGSGVKEMISHYQIPADYVWVFGDNYNDVQMLQAVKHSVAMGNAPDDVKKQTAYVTDSNNDDGIAKILNKYLG